jgi:hypothetical protein
LSPPNKTPIPPSINASTTRSQGLMMMASSSSSSSSRLVSQSVIHHQIDKLLSHSAAASQQYSFQQVIPTGKNPIEQDKKTVVLWKECKKKLRVEEEEAGIRRIGMPVLHKS